MSKTTKALAVLGVVAGLGVSMLPLSSYAAPVTDSATLQVSTTIQPTISVDILAGDAGSYGGTADAATLDLGNLTNNGHVEGNVKVTVKTNDVAGYDLAVKATAAANVNLVGAATGKTIEPGTTIADDQATSAWAYKIAKQTTGNANGDKGDITTGFDSYQAITDSDVTIASATKSTADDSYTFTVGVAANGSQEADTYSSSLTFTATGKTN